MSSGKSSLSLGLINCALVGGLIWAFQLLLPLGIGDDTDLIIAAALAAGVAMGVTNRLLCTGFEQNLKQFISHLKHLASPDMVSQLGQNKPWQQQADQILSGLRARFDELVTRHHTLELELRLVDAARRRAETIMDVINDPVLVTDSSDDLALCNQAAAKALHFDRDKVSHQSIDHVVRIPALSALIRETRDSGRCLSNNQIERPGDESNRAALYEVTLAPLMDRPNESVNGVVTILHDVTGQRQAAEMKGDFISSVSHELRTPLSSIKAYAEMLMDGEADDEQTRVQFYNIIQGEANRLGQLIDNILVISRIESGMARVRREHFNLGDLVNETVQVMRSQARAKHLDMPEPVVPREMYVYADRDMICQTMLQLLSNAIQYTPENGKIMVGGEIDQETKLARVWVKDNGLGIPAGDLPLIFSKFYRVADHKRASRGTGLGLSLVKNVIETVHGGRITVVSEPGKGSTFTFTLPLEQSGAKEQGVEDSIV